MPSNAELQAAIAARAEVLVLTVDTSGMNNATLAETLKGLMGQETAEELAAEAAAAPAPAAKPSKKRGYFVAKGASITSARGILAEGEEVRPGDVPDEARDVLVDLDVIEKH
jgi:hypothetical protein